MSVSGIFQNTENAVKALKRGHCSPRILIIGHARHGKDTVCEMLRDDYGYSFMSSSWFCAEHVVMPYVAARNHPYPSVVACYEDRANHRGDWHDAIWEYNKPDPARLGKEIWSKYNIYAGLRHSTEWAALKNEGAYDIAIWVDRSLVLPPEPESSMKLSPWMADYILDNNWDLDHLRRGLAKLVKVRL